MAAHEIKLELNDIRDLFRRPTANDPFLPNYRALPGIEQIALFMKGDRRRDREQVRIMITLFLDQLRSGIPPNRSYSIDIVKVN
jgi:hypothetical protein